MRNASSFKSIYAGFLCTISCLAFNAPAQGGFVLSLADNVGNSATIDIFGTHLVSSASGIGSYSPGDIDFNGAVGAFSIDLEGLSKPILGSINSGLMTLVGRVSAAAGTSTTLTISLTDTDFPKESVFRDKVFGIGNVTGGSVKVEGWFDPANVEFGQGGLYEDLGTFTGPFNGSIAALFPYGQVPFSELLQLTATPLSSTDPYLLTLDSTGVIQHVPEPSSFALLGLGGLGLAIRTCRRKKNGAGLVSQA